MGLEQGPGEETDLAVSETGERSKAELAYEEEVRSFRKFEKIGRELSLTQKIEKGIKGEEVGGSDSYYYRSMKGLSPEEIARGEATVGASGIVIAALEMTELPGQEKAQILLQSLKVALRQLKALEREEMEMGLGLPGMSPDFVSAHRRMDIENTEHKIRQLE